VLCFISAYLAGGLEGHLYPELYGPGQVNVEATIEAAKTNRDLVRGVKAHAETGGVSRWGLEVIRLGKQIARGADLPLYIHLGQLWPTVDSAAIPDADELIRELIPVIEDGDMLAHPFTRHPGGFVSATGEIHPILFEAVQKGGVKVDVGHGSHFSFAVARKVIDAGIVPYTLGADMHGYNVTIPASEDDDVRRANPFAGVAPFNLTIAMSELLHLGVGLDDILAMVTINPARILRMDDEIGSLRVGREADISALRLETGRFKLLDNTGAEEICERLITPAFCLRAGEYFEVDSPLVPGKIAA
jgi:dihydroorotase